MGVKQEGDEVNSIRAKRYTNKMRLQRTDPDGQDSPNPWY